MRHIWNGVLELSASPTDSDGRVSAASEAISNLRRAFPFFAAAPKVLWVTSAGGHLAEALRIEEMMGLNPESLWVTSKTPQSESLLSARRTSLQPYVAPRDVVGSIRVSNHVRSWLRAENFDLIASTGAALAAATLLRSARHLRTIYFESLARSDGPSLTGRIVSRVQAIDLITQDSSWASGRWSYAGSILDTWDAKHVFDWPSDRPMQILVTLGTIRPYRFDRLIDAVLTLLRPNDKVIWQLGETTREGLPGATHTHLAADDLASMAASSDVVVTHAGVGNVMMSLGAGRTPVLAGRTRAYGEHVDDHQRQLVRNIVSRGLGEEFDLTTPDRSTLLRAAGRQARDRLS